MKNVRIGILVALAVTAALFFAWRFYNPNVPLWGGKGTDVYCTADAKLCSDGSYVGRVPPDCEFAACPAGSSDNQSGASVTLETKIDQGASGLDVKVIPLAILEDSRCPLDVQCIQAGTVRIRALLSSGLGEATQIFELGKPITTEAESVELIEVRPYPQEDVQVDAFGYTFVFKVMKR